MPQAAVLNPSPGAGYLLPPPRRMQDARRLPGYGQPRPWQPRRTVRDRLADATHGIGQNSKEWLRAGVFGGMDGSSSTLGLIAALAGAGAGPGAILTAAASGGIAGAASMGAGEYVSVKTDNERIAQAVGDVRAGLRADPSRVRAELASLLTEQNPHLSPEVATAYAQNLWSDPVLGERYHVATKLGEWPEDPAKPRNAATSSLAAFALGAILPTLPYIGVATGALSGGLALPLSMAAGGLGLFGAGALSSRFSEGKWWKHGTRQLTAGAFTGGVSYVAAMGLTSMLGAGLAGTALPAVAVASAAGMAALAGYRLLRRRTSRKAARDLRAELAATPAPAFVVAGTNPGRWQQALEMSQSRRAHSPSIAPDSPGATPDCPWTAPGSCPWLAASPTPPLAAPSASPSR